MMEDAYDGDEFGPEQDEGEEVERNAEAVEEEENGAVIGTARTGVAVGPGSVWGVGGARKHQAIRKLVEYFGGMIDFEPMDYAIPDHKGRYKANDLIYKKLLDAPLKVTKVKKILIKNESYDTREFTIYISKQKWAKNILRPLLEHCTLEDTILAMRCCGLLLILLKRVSEYTQKVLQRGYKVAKKKTLSLIPSTAQNNDKSKSIELKEDEKSDEEGEKKTQVVEVDDTVEMAKQRNELENAKQQVVALISFKEAVSTEGCCTAMVNAFQLYWERESSAREGESVEDDKLNLAMLFSYVRRILAVDGHRAYSSVGEVMANRNAHYRLIVNFRRLLNILPSLCSDIMRPYHSDWLTDIILIIYFCVQEFSAKELYLVWHRGGILSNLDDLEVDDAPESMVETDSFSHLPHQNVTAAASASASSSLLKPAISLGTGLSDRLKKEKADRLNTLKSRGVAGGRYKSTFKTTMSTLPPPPSMSSSAAGTSNMTSRVKITRDAFADPSMVVPQAKEGGRNKKSTTFMTNDRAKKIDTGMYSSASVLEGANLTSSGKDKEQAAVVVASIVNLLAHEVALKPLVKRINEDLRRDEMRIGPEMELRYFEILGKVLHYNRLKIQEERRKFLDASMASASMQSVDDFSSNRAPAWEPNLRNIMDALDRMSFTRVISAIERISKHNDKLSELLIPVTLIKEMVCYLGVLLESSILGHQEIAVAAMFRMFYAKRDQRHDPLPSLLSLWRPGTFCKKYCSTLLELVHETLKTLDLAHAKFGPEGAGAEAMASARAKKGRKKDKEFDVGMALYSSACLQFDVDDYFKKLVTNHSVNIYTMMLGHYSTNETSVNHHIYTFLRRMTSFKLEQEFQVGYSHALQMQIERNGVGVQQKNSNSNSNTGSIVEVQTQEQEAHDPNASTQLSAAEFTHIMSGEALESQTQPQALTQGGGGGGGGAGETHAPGASTSTMKPLPLATDAPYEHVNLGYMLFNINSLLVFSTLLNDDSVYRIKSMGPLISLVKGVCRRFGRAADKNRMLYVEVLHPHGNAKVHCCMLDNVYEASAFAVRHTELSSKPLRKSKHEKERRKEGKEGKRSKEDGGKGKGSEDEGGTADEGSSEDSDEDHRQRQMAKQRRLTEELGDEFDETDARATTAGLKPVPKQRKNKGGGKGKGSIPTDGKDKKEKKKKEGSRIVSKPSKGKTPRSGSKKTKTKSKKDVYLSDTASDGSDAPGKSKKQKRLDSSNEKKVKANDKESSDDSDLFSDSEKKSKGKDEARVSSRVSRGKWTDEEDTILREQYMLYKGTRSVFTSIAMHEDLRNCSASADKPYRSEAAIERRVKELMLHLEGGDSDSSSDDDDKDDDKESDNNNNDNDDDNAMADDADAIDDDNEPTTADEPGAGSVGELMIEEEIQTQTQTQTQGETETYDMGAYGDTAGAGASQSSQATAAQGTNEGADVGAGSTQTKTQNLQLPPTSAQKSSSVGASKSGGKEASKSKRGKEKGSSAAERERILSPIDDSIFAVDAGEMDMLDRRGQAGAGLPASGRKSVGLKRRKPTRKDDSDEEDDLMLREGGEEEKDPDNRALKGTDTTTTTASSSISSSSSGSSSSSSSNIGSGSSSSSSSSSSGSSSSGAPSSSSSSSSQDNTITNTNTNTNTEGQTHSQGENENQTTDSTSADADAEVEASSEAPIPTPTPAPAPTLTNAQRAQLAKKKRMTIDSDEED